MIGLDIGSRFIKICQVEPNDGGHQIISAAMIPNPAVSQGSKQESALSNRIKALLRETSLSSKVTASSINGCQILARNFAFPEMTQKELAGALRLEVEQSVSSDLNTMFSDHQVLGPLDDGRMDVLFIAVPRQMVDRSAEVIENAGLELECVDIDNLALVNAYAAFEPDCGNESVLLLNIGHSYTNIAVIDGGALRFIRNVNFGGKDVSAEIANYYGISIEMAEEIKRQPELWGDIGLSIKNVLRKTMPDLLEAIYRTIEYCMSRKKLVNVDRILITGGTSYLHGIDGFLSEALGINTGKWNPLSKLVMKGKSRKELGQYLGVALGLALRRENHV